MDRQQCDWRGERLRQQQLQLGRRGGPYLVHVEEEEELRKAVEAWTSGKSTKKATKVTKVEHREMGEEIRNQALQAFNSGPEERGGTRGNRASGGKRRGGASGSGTSRGAGEGKRKLKKRWKGSSTSRVTDREGMERFNFEGNGISSDSSGTEGDSDKSGSSFGDSDERRRSLDEQETKLASGGLGSATREARGGGPRKRLVKPLSSGGGSTQTEGAVVSLLEEIVEDRRAERAQRAGGAGAGGGSGSGSAMTQNDLEKMEERVVSRLTNTIANVVADKLADVFRQSVGGYGAPQANPSYPAAGAAGQHLFFPREAPQQYPSYPATGAAFPYEAGAAGAGAPASAVGAASGGHASGGHNEVRREAARATAASATQPGADGVACGAKRARAQSRGPLPGFTVGAGRQGIDCGAGHSESARQGGPHRTSPSAPSPLRPPSAPGLRTMWSSRSLL